MILKGQILPYNKNLTISNSINSNFGYFDQIYKDPSVQQVADQNIKLTKAILEYLSQEKMKSQKTDCTKEIPNMKTRQPLS